MKKIAIALTATFALSTLAACGGSEADAFCDDMNSLGKDAASLSASDPAGLAKKLKDVDVPSEIKDDYNTFVSYLESTAKDPASAAEGSAKALESWGKVTTYAADNCS